MCRMDDYQVVTDLTSDSLLSEIPLSEKKERINHNQLRLRLNISLTAGIEHVT